MRVEAGLPVASFRYEQELRGSVEISKNWIPLLVFPSGIEAVSTNRDAWQSHPVRPSDLAMRIPVQPFLSAAPAGGLLYRAQTNAVHGLESKPRKPQSLQGGLLPCHFLMPWREAGGVDLP